MSQLEELNLMEAFLISVTLVLVLLVMILGAVWYVFKLYFNNRPVHKPKFNTNTFLNNQDVKRDISITIPLIVEFQSQSSTLLPITSKPNELRECDLQKRQQWNVQSQNQDVSEQQWNVQPQKQDVSDASDIIYSAQGYESTAPDELQSLPASAERYSGLRVIAELKLGDPFPSANIVTSVEFDRDDEHFATAGVSRCIKVYEFSSVLNESAEMHCPVAEMTSQSKLSCLTWNKYIKREIASSDYAGTIAIWDASTCQNVMEYEEHEKRAWSVDFSHTEPSMLVSGGDDCKVKVWCTKQEASAMNIDMKANVCSVKYNPTSGNFIAVGSADHQIYYYDLRNIIQPLHVFSGSKKAVSYVRFLSSNELVSASTDKKLRLWDVKENLSPLRTFRGHLNKKNFVGLTANSEYIGCGSETNEVFVYHKALPKPLARLKFGDEDDNSIGLPFVSAVCWKNGSPIMLAANSQGKIKVLELTTA